jgi:peptide/nickel transport system permease protein
MIPTLFGVSLITFGLIRLAPGDPAGVQFGSESTVPGGTANLEKFRARYLLDQPLWRQYLHYVGPFDLSARGHRWFGGDGEHPWNGLLAGDLGRFYNRPNVRVADELRGRLAVTVPLALCATLLTYLIAIPIGIWSAVRRGTVLDRAATLLLFALYAMPAFWAGLLLQLAFGRTGLDLLPVIGLHDKDAAELGPGARALDTLRHLILPIVVYSYGGIAYVSRQMRAGMAETIRQDYVRTARAKGLPERVVVLKHVLRNSLIPVLTLLGSLLPYLIGGSIIVEVVFDIPGMGRFAYEALTLREYDAIMATTLFAALMTMAGVLLSDVAYALVDPRIRYG